LAIGLINHQGRLYSHQKKGFFMAETFTIATFNAENLFTRFKFKTQTDADKAVRGGFIIEPDKFEELLEESRVLTAKAIKALNADFLGLQEIENLDTLKLFNRTFLKDLNVNFNFPLLIDGNDTRLIDVGLLSNLPIVNLRTHQFIKAGAGNSFVFSRDCLEVEVQVGAKIVHVFINHFKSMLGGREQTKSRREQQSQTVLNLLQKRFGNDFGEANFVVLGDLNDYLETDREDECGIRALLQSEQMENVVLRLPLEEQWTHFFKGDKTYNQLDYILISKALADKNPDVLPVIERRGQPKRVNQPGKPEKVTEFFPEVTGDLKASDHCPVAITLKV
jgi:predicted extracellular nuclease